MRPRTRRQVIFLHKWIGITIGVLIVMWLVTGVVMILPYPQTLPPASIPYDSMTVSPAQAIRVAQAHAEGRQVRNVLLRGLGTTLLYQVNLVGAPAVLVDGQTGTVVRITDSIAVAVARASLGPDVDIDKVEILERRRLDYLFGALPAYRVEIGDGRGTLLHLGVRDGRVRASTGRSRLVTGMGFVHTFEVLRLARANQRVERWLLIVTSTISLVSVVTGYLLFRLPRRWRRAR